MGRESQDLTFGGVTIATAVVAILLGGWALDRVGSSIKNAMLLHGIHRPVIHTAVRSACVSSAQENCCAEQCCSIMHGVKLGMRSRLAKL